MMDLENAGTGRNGKLDVGGCINNGTLSNDSGITFLARILGPVLPYCWTGSLKLGNNNLNSI